MQNTQEQMIAIYQEKTDNLSNEVNVLRTRMHKIANDTHINTAGIKSLSEERKILFKNIESKIENLDKSLEKLNNVVESVTITLNSIQNFKYKLIGWFAAFGFFVTLISILLSFLK
jgi:tetrahydromethanopterin S-methyltransferase subunit B